MQSMLSSDRMTGPSDSSQVTLAVVVAAVADDVFVVTMTAFYNLWKVPVILMRVSVNADENDYHCTITLS